MVGIAPGVNTHLVVPPVGEVYRPESDSVITPSLSTMEKTANGLDQPTRQGLVILSTAQVSALLKLQKLLQYFVILVVVKPL